jgi:hypothetical protein
MYDPTRWAMHQYSLEEQTRIIREGAQFLQSWTGQPVVAHRAGAYAADVNTLVALERNGIALDSSVFWKYEHTRLDGIGLPRNLPGQYGRVTEIPVSVYERVDHAPLVSRVLAAAPVVRKIDPNWYANVGEVAASIDALLAADVPLLVVFLHSYSFMSEPGTDGTRADGHALEMFHAVVDHIATKNLPVVTMRQLVEARSPLSLAAARDVVPRVVVRVDVPRYVWHRIRTVDRITLASLFAAIGLGTMLALWLMGKRLLSANRRPVVLGARAR